MTQRIYTMFTLLMHSIVIFADGACSGNPGPGGWGVILAFPKGNVVELGGRKLDTTNNQMELTAVGQALRYLENIAGDVDIYTDSSYVINGITKWVWGWKKKEWKTANGKDVANVEYWKRLMAILGKRKSDFPESAVEWKYSRGHSGIPGNERVDEIAVKYSKGEHVRLYEGPLLKYDVAVYDLPENTEVPEPKKRGALEEKKAAYSYLSLVGGTPMRHATWTECERRVKGVPGAKFKKSHSSDDEKKILESWGAKTPEKGATPKKG